MTLNNAIQDDSFLHQCISNDLFAAAGVPAPRCGFVRLAVNGDDLGLYVDVESIDKRFLRRHFDSDQGNLYEGTFSDFRPTTSGSTAIRHPACSRSCPGAPTARSRTTGSAPARR